ncbi:diguanylate cyclase [Hydrogenophilus thermoluteolus]|nr:diguanylate cyclase [Hydrogenophilus thermoluteolus]
MNLPIFRRSLFSRWVPWLLLVQLLLFAAFGAFFWREAQSAANTLALQRLHTLQLELAAALQGPLLERDIPTLREIAEALVQNGEIAYLAIFNGADERLVLVGASAETSLPDGKTLAALSAAETRLPNRFDVRLPLISGAVQVGYSPQPLIGLIDRFAETGILVIGGTTLLTFALYLGFFFRVAKRLGAIERTAEQIAAGNLRIRAPEGTHDEIARLGNAFNRMADELAECLTALTIAERETEATLDTLEAEHAQLTALLEAMRLGVLLVDTSDRVVFANSALRRLWHIPAEALLVGQNARNVMRLSDTLCAEPDHFSQLLLTVPGTQEISDSTEIHLIDGRILLQLCFPVRDSHQRLIGRLWLYEDITRERRSAEQLIYLAERDGLTGLYNRRRFAELLEEKLNEALRQRRTAALLLFDIDEFKQLNDTFGHRAGDALLARIASELTAITRSNEIVGRLGGDEFAILLPAYQNRSEPQQLAERIIRALARIPFDFDGQRIGITVSLGVALFPRTWEQPRRAHRRGRHRDVSGEKRGTQHLAVLQHRRLRSSKPHPTQLEPADRTGTCRRVVRAPLSGGVSSGRNADPRRSAHSHARPRRPHASGFPDPFHPRCRKEWEDSRDRSLGDRTGITDTQRVPRRATHRSEPFGPHALRPWVCDVAGKPMAPSPAARPATALRDHRNRSDRRPPRGDPLCPSGA